jgi:hypothetical protein
MNAARAALALLSWRPHRQNTLRGFASVRLQNGLAIHDVVVHTSHNRSWASLPSKPMLDKSGAALRDSETGKLRYAPILEWPDRATANRFSDAVVELVEREHPGAVRS